MQVYRQELLYGEREAKSSLEVANHQLKQQLEQEIFKIDSYTNLVLQYLRLESFHDDLVLKQLQIEDLVKETLRKYTLFFIQKGLNVNLHDLDKEIVTDKKVVTSGH